ncbi:hypothetical protein H206_05567 [Candidatus Electrothrix aarhusensis]|uniref:Uncharacterized protein n=1 Tax=Candidatus Electrothrix aarhusensis TaxID=1859131 RepID=A0A3S4TCW1_9BACT|nr:hypothetical protein H206_05567 [Candidatus Electrothrix aarhusensis]
MPARGRNWSTRESPFKRISTGSSWTKIEVVPSFPISGSNFSRGRGYSLLRPSSRGPREAAAGSCCWA